MNYSTKIAREPLVINPSKEANCAIIWLHGLGANAHDFEGIVPLLPIEKHQIRMVFPNAPEQAVTINGGMVMPAWYDISDIAFRHADTKGIAQSNATIQQLIQTQIDAGIDSKKIILAGFSQGGAMALHSGLRCVHELAGVIGLSCYVLDRENNDKAMSEKNQNTPILMAHGENDNVVSYTLGKSSCDFLKERNYTVEFLTYPIAHEVSMPEITTLSEWISTQLT